MKRWIALVLFAMALPGHAALLYAVQRLDGVSYGWDVNDHGTVVGEQEQPTGGPHGVIWRAGSITDLGADLQSGRAINSAGVVVGTVRPGLGSLAGFRWENGVVTQGSAQRILDINDAGDMVFQPSFVLGARANAVSNTGWLVGGAPSPPFGREHATLWKGAQWSDDGAFLDFGSLADTVDLGVLNPGNNNATSIATAVSDVGVVVGYGEGRAFRWFEGQLAELGAHPAGFTGSQAHALNEHGEIVGLVEAIGVSAAMYFSDAQGMVNLNDLIDPRSPLFGSFELTIARAIDERGVILANGFDATGRQQAYVLSPLPVPAPSGPALAVFALVFALLILRRSPTQARVPPDGSNNLATSSA